MILGEFFRGRERKIIKTFLFRRENRKLQRRLNVNGGESGLKENGNQDFVPKLDAIEGPNEVLINEESPHSLVNGEGGSQLVNGVCKSEKSDEDFINITNGGDRMDEGKHCLIFKRN